MSGSDRDSIFSFYPETVALAAGATMTLDPVPGQNFAKVKWISGGSLMMFAGYSNGLGASGYAFSQMYLLGTTEILEFPLSGPMYLVAVGSTSVFNVLRGRSTPHAIGSTMA